MVRALTCNLISGFCGRYLDPTLEGLAEAEESHISLVNGEIHLLGDLGPLVLIVGLLPTPPVAIYENTKAFRAFVLSCLRFLAYQDIEFSGLQCCSS